MFSEYDGGTAGMNRFMDLDSERNAETFATGLRLIQ